MSTSMLDALAAEAKEITLLGAEASRLAIDALRRSNLLTQQIQRLAAEEGAAPPSISADADEAEFLAFQAEHFPDLVFGGQQDVEPSHEPVAADVADDLDPGPGIAPPLGLVPEPQRTRRDHALDLYAESDIGLRALAREVGVSSSSIESYISSARRAADRRVAQGDLLREKEIVSVATPPERPARAIPAGLVEPETKPTPTQPTDEQPKGDNLLALNMDKCTAAYQGQGIQLVRHEWRMLLLLNDRQPKPVSAMLERCQVLSRRRLHAEISKLNARIALIGIEIHENDDDTFVARPLKAA